MAAPDLEISKARALLGEALAGRASVAVSYHADADGIASAALAAAALERAGATPLPVTPAKAENVYAAGFVRLLDGLGARANLMLDTGSRPNAAFGSTPSIVVDHHPTAGRPAVAAFVHDDASPATTLLAFELLSALAPLEDRRWLVSLGVLGDAGSRARDENVVSAGRLFGRQALREVVALVNASGRAAVPAPEVALAALRNADDPRSIVRGATGEARFLHEIRTEVAAAIRRARHVPPRARGRFAVIELDDPCRIHGVIASAWARRLSPLIVLVANVGYSPGRVHLSVRSHEELDLRAELRALLPDGGPDFAAGHARASGAIVDTGTYAELLQAIDRSGPLAPRRFTASERTH